MTYRAWKRQAAQAKRLWRQDIKRWKGWHLRAWYRALHVGRSDDLRLIKLGKFHHEVSL